MYHYKATTYQQMEKPRKEKNIKQNEYEEIRKLVEENEGNDIVKYVKNKKNKNQKILITLNYVIKYSLIIIFS